MFVLSHGEVLIQVLKGNCYVSTTEDEVLLKEHDQVLLTEGEEFRTSKAEEAEEVVLQMVWMPGPYLCQKCWAAASSYFNK